MQHRHERHELSHEHEPAWVTESVDFSNSTIDRGIDNGIREMARTPGLYANPTSEIDVLALAFRRGLTAGIPLSATIGEVLDRLTVRAEGQGPRVS